MDVIGDSVGWDVVGVVVGSFVVGEVLGDAVGLTDGYPVGKWVGFAVGWLLVGDAVGVGVDGYSVGIHDGNPDGSWVGCVLGDPEGAAVGAVGDLVGATVISQCRPLVRGGQLAQRYSAGLTPGGRAKSSPPEPAPLVSSRSSSSESTGCSSTQTPPFRQGPAAQGCGEGPVVGLTLGAEEGNVVGAKVGKWVGDTVGPAVGFADGVVDG